MLILPWRDFKEDCGSERKEGNCREYIKDRMQNVGRNVTVKGDSDGGSQAEMRNMLLDSGENAVLAISWQRTWPNCIYVLVFCGK